MMCSWAREGETMRERSKHALEKVAELEAQIRSKGLDLPPAVTLPSEEGGDDTAQAARWNENDSESESDEELGERGMFENSWSQSPVRTAAESAPAAVVVQAADAVSDADGQHHTESAGTEAETQNTETGSSSHEGIGGGVSDVVHVEGSPAYQAEEEVEEATPHTHEHEPRQDTDEVRAESPSEANPPTLQSGSLDSPVARQPRLSSTHSQHSYTSTGSTHRRGSSRNASLTAALDAVNGGKTSPQPRQYRDDVLESASADFEDVSLP